MQEIAGTWKLVHYGLHFDDGRTIHPFGADAVGRIHYCTDGIMTAHLMKTDRPAVSDAEFVNPSPETATRIVGDYFSYCGTWTIEAGIVTHRIELCSHPGWVGTRQRRDVRFEGAELILSAGIDAYEATRGEAVLRWRRV